MKDCEIVESVFSVIESVHEFFKQIPENVRIIPVDDDGLYVSLYAKQQLMYQNPETKTKIVYTDTTDINIKFDGLTILCAGFLNNSNVLEPFERIFDDSDVCVISVGIKVPDFYTGRASPFKIYYHQKIYEDEIFEYNL